MTKKSKDTTAKAATREARVAAGLCGVCGKEPLVAGLRYGKKCRKRSLVYYKLKQSRRKKAGNCIRCGEPGQGKVHCPACLQKASEFQSRQYRRRKRAGVCVYCEDAIDPGSSVCCLKHLDMNRNHQRKYQAARAAK